MVINRSFLTEYLCFVLNGGETWQECVHDFRFPVETFLRSHLTKLCANYYRYVVPAGTFFWTWHYGPVCVCVSLSLFFPFPFLFLSLSSRLIAPDRCVLSAQAFLLAPGADVAVWGPWLFLGLQMDGRGEAGPHGRSFTLALNGTEEPAKHAALHSRAAMFAQRLQSTQLNAPTCWIIMLDIAVF